MFGKDSLCRIAFEHADDIAHRVFLWDIHGEMGMVEGKAHLAELKAIGFELLESCDAGINDALSPEAVISAFGDEL